MKMFKALVLLLVALLSGGYSYGQRYWVAKTPSNWNNTANWSMTSGGSSGASVPGVSDAVIFDGGGGSQGSCLLDIAPTVASIAVNGYNAAIDLNGNHLTISGSTAVTLATGTITNSGSAASLFLTTSGAVTFSGTQFGNSIATEIEVMCVADQVYLNGSIFYGSTYIEKSGATHNLGAGGNIFNGVTIIVNSGSGYLTTGFNLPDVFNGDLTVTNVGSSFIGIADNTANNMFNGNINLNSWGTGSGFFSGILFGSGPAAAGAKSSYLAAGKSITVGNGAYGSTTLSLAGFHQMDSATPQAITTTGTSVLYIGPSSSFAGDVTFKAPQLYLQGCAYSGAAYLEKTGDVNNLGSGGNTFQSSATIVNSGSACLATGFSAPDVFNSDVTVTNTGTGWVALADNATGSAFNGNIFINSTNATPTAGVTFGNGPGTTATATLADGKKINIGNIGFSAGRLLLRRFTQAGSTAQNVTLTGTSIAYLGPYTTFNASTRVTSPQIYLDGCRFNSNAYIEKNGANNNGGAGGNIFNGTTTLVNSGSGMLESATTTADTFNGDLILTNTGPSLISLASASAVNVFNGNIEINSTAGAGVKFANDTTAGGAMLAPGKTITTGSGGFTVGTLTLQNFTQIGTAPQNITLSGTATLILGPSAVFNGDVNIVGPRILLNGCTYNGSASITKNGTTTNTCDGGNVFNGVTNLTNDGTATWLLANTTGDTFNGPVTFSKTSSGALQPAFNGTNTFYNDVNISSSGVITFGAGAGVVEIAGSNNQVITSAGAVPVIQRLTMNKTSANNTVTLNTPVDIGVMSTLTNGIIQTSSTNYINYMAGSSSTGGSNDSYIDGPVRKTGNSDFTFPTGDASVYRSISISAPANVTDVFTAQYFKNGQTFGNESTYTSPLVSVSACEHWILDRTIGTSSVNVGLSWKSSDCGSEYITDPADLRVARWNGNAWESHGNGGVTGDATAGTIVTESAVANFSPFALGARVCFTSQSVTGQVALFCRRTAR
jgi:hypothetical protein